MRTVLVLSLTLALAATMMPTAAADELCVGDGPLGFCVVDPADNVAALQPLPIYCLHVDGVGCPGPDPR